MKSTASAGFQPLSCTAADLANPKWKTRIRIRIDQKILDWFHAQVERAGRGSYQTLINQVPSKYIREAKEPLETTLRRVIREELSQAR